MSNRKRLVMLAVAATPFISALLGSSSAWAAACVTAPVTTYEASGFSCNVGPVTFSDIVVLGTTSGSGTVVLTDFSPFSVVVGGVTEYGLHLFYSASTGATPGSLADVGWTYNVSGVPALTDAYETFTGVTTGTGSADLSETLSNGVTLNLTAPGAANAVFTAVSFLGVIKDQADLNGTAGFAETSILGNAFSVSGVPESSTWGMMLLGFAGLGFAAFRKARKPIAIV